MEILSSEEAYLINKNGIRKRICGAVRKDGRYCTAGPGYKTDHSGIGYCLRHDRSLDGRLNWLKMAAARAKGSTLSVMLENAANLDLELTDLSNEVRFQQSMILWYIDFVMKRDPEPEFTKDDINFLRGLNADVIRGKESAARIKGSMKLNALEVRQFIDQIFSFLVGRLSGLLDKAVMAGILQEMASKVFLPMTATGAITGQTSKLVELPEKYRNLNLLNGREPEE